MSDLVDFLRRSAGLVGPIGIGKLKRALEYARLTWSTPGLQISFGTVLLECKLDEFVRIGNQCHLDHVSMGRHSYIGAHGRVIRTNVGKFTSIAPNVTIGLGAHSLEGISTHPIFYLHNRRLGMTLIEQDHWSNEHIFPQTTIGSDVWIGTDVLVREGVSIGHGAVVGAGAVVTKDVPPFAISCGVPARVQRYRFDCNMIEFLLRLQWWDKSDTWLKENAAEFRTVRSFVERHRDSEFRGSDTTSP